MTLPSTVSVTRNPGPGRPWAVIHVSDGLFEFRLFRTRGEALDAAKVFATSKLHSGVDYTVAAARLPRALPAELAVEAWIDAADDLLARTFQKRGR